MPDQTYLQQAQPSTFGHYILAFTYPTMRDAERLLTEQKLLNRSPGGAGCVNGSRLKIDRDRTAELLGFDDVITHTRDAMWQTDGLVAILADIASLVGNFSKVAEDLEIWDSSEFDFVQLGGPYTRASVLMPQKRNPYSLAIVRGASGILVGRLSGFLAVIKTPSARSDNLIFAYGEVPRAVELAGRITRLMSGVIGSLELHPDRMWQSLLAGFSQATDLAEYVMQACNVDYRSAYHIVGTAVRRAAQAGMRGVDVTGEMLDEAALEQVGHPLGLSGQDLRELLDPRKIALERNSTGGAAPQVVRRMAASARREAEGIRRAAARRAAAYEAAEAALVSRAEALTRG
jgi:argininosuccinate lyase